VRECTEKLSGRIAACGCSLELHLEEPMVGDWDREKLQQVVSNLVTNAVDAGRGEPVDVSLREEGVAAVLSLRHRGSEVADEDRERLFEPLALPEEMDSHVRGLGVGLYVSRALVQAMGGTVSIESTREPGATLRVRLPREVPHRCGSRA
jgi:signal transduction histidine kinase